MSASVAPAAPVAAISRSRSLLASPIVRKASAYASRVVTHVSCIVSDAAKPPPPMQIVCSLAVFRCSWLLINFFQFALSVALLRALYSYVWTLLDHEEIVAALQQFGLEFNGRVMLGSVVATTATMIPHVIHVAHSIRYSIRRRRLVLHDDGDELKDPTTTKRSPSLRVCGLHWPLWMQPKIESLRGAVRACGVHGAYFDVGLYGRELLEISLQTYQTYRVSYAVGEAWINNLAVAVVVVNCWTTPLLDLWLHADEPRRRMMCLAVDVVLDTVAALVIPFFVYASYRSKLPQMDWYDPLWIMDAGNDLMYFHVNAWLDLLSRLMPGFSMIHCLHAIRAMLKPRQPPTERSTASARVVAVVPQPRAPVPSSTALSSSRPRVALIHKLLFSYGAIILAVGVLAQKGPHLTPALPGCQKSTRPWLLPNAKYPCAVLELNCEADPHFSDDDTAMEERLADADASALAALVITHCPRVRMPPRLAAFRNLLWLEIYNSTLVEWSEAAALTQTTHPLLSRALFVRGSVDTATLSVDTLLQRLVLSPLLPHTLLDVAIVASNLSTASTAAPRSRLTPRVLLSLVMQQCELTAIPSLPSVTVQSLSLSLNPIVTANLSAVQANVISLQSTRVENCTTGSSSTTTGGLVYAGDSPLCVQQPAAQALSCPAAQTIACTPHATLFPLASLDARANRGRQTAE